MHHSQTFTLSRAGTVCMSNACYLQTELATEMTSSAPAMARATCSAHRHQPSWQCLCSCQSGMSGDNHGNGAAAANKA